MELVAPRVIIVGGGFGGLSAARALRRAPLRVTLIDKRNYHLFRPMLYQVATGLLSADEIAGPLRSILSRQNNIAVLLDEVTGITAKQRTVHLKHRDLPYDFLILATGIRYNYFGHDEWRRFAPGLESLDDADMIRSKILLAFERAEEIASRPQAPGEAATREIRRLLTFALVGGGTVGVEMAGTLAEMSQMALAHDFRHIDPRSAKILLYEAGPRILPTYPETLSSKAKKHLESLGVEVFTNARVMSVDSDGILVDGQRVPAGTVLWGAGVVASPAGRWLGAETDKSGKIMVEPDFSVRDYPEVFVIGDTAHVVAPVRNLFGIKSAKPKVIPGVAQPAIQEGEYVADVIRRRVEGRAQPKPFWYWDKGERRANIRRRRVTLQPFCGLRSVGDLGSRTHLFSHWICQSAFRVAAVGAYFFDKTSSSASLVSRKSIGAERNRSSGVRFAALASKFLNRMQASWALRLATLNAMNQQTPVILTAKNPLIAHHCPSGR